MSSLVQLPSQSELTTAMLEILSNAPDGLHVEEIEKAVAKKLALTDAQKNLMHKGNRTMLGYKLAWARSSARKTGLIDSVKHSVWKIAR